MSDVQFIWFFIVCAVLWVILSTACWYYMLCDDYKYKKYITITPMVIFGAFVCNLLGPLVWFSVIFVIIIRLIGDFIDRYNPSFTIKNHFYRGY